MLLYTCCQSVGCENVGFDRGDCSYCSHIIVRCGACAERFKKLTLCVKCTGGRGVVGIARRDIVLADEDANGWLSNARKHLEEGC